jgi:uncharacterized membrane protein
VLVAFFCSPFLIKILDYQFHPEAFYVPLFLWFAYLIETKRWKGLWVVAALILSVKEDGAIYLAAAAGAAFLTRRMSLKQAFKLIAVSIVVFILNVKWIIPANSPAGEYHLAGTSAKYGSTVSDAALGMLTHWNTVLLALLKGAWLKNLFRFLFLPLLEPYFLIAIAPFALIHSVAESNVMRGLATYYSAPYLPWIFVGFVLILARKRIPERLRSFAIVFAVLTSVPAWYPRHLPTFHDVQARESDFQNLTHWISQGSSICAQGAIFPHLKYPEYLDILSEDCIKASTDYYVFNLSLNLWPYSLDEVKAMMKSLDENPAYFQKQFGDFILYTKKLKAPGGI